MSIFEFRPQARHQQYPLWRRHRGAAQARELLPWRTVEQYGYSKEDRVLKPSQVEQPIKLLY